MLQVILGFLLGLIFIFLLMYTCDDGIVWDCRIRLRQPSLSDVDLSNELRASYYVEHVVCPSYHYFILEKEMVSQFSEGSAITILGTTIYLILPCVLLSASGIRSLGAIKSFFFCSVISVAILSLLGFLIYFVYKRTLKISRYDYTPADFARDREHLSHFPSEYGESLDCTLNNHAISLHYQYLLPLRKTVRTRIAFRRILIFLGIASYIFLFLPYIEY